MKQAAVPWVIAPVAPAPVYTIRHLLVESSHSFTMESMPQDSTYWRGKRLVWNTDWAGKALAFKYFCCFTVIIFANIYLLDIFHPWKKVSIQCWWNIYCFKHARNIKIIRLFILVDWIIAGFWFSVSFNGILTTSSIITQRTAKCLCHLSFLFSFFSVLTFMKRFLRKLKFYKR